MLNGWEKNLFMAIKRLVAAKQQRKKKDFDTKFIDEKVQTSLKDFD